jgi:hypothetical protein
VTVKRSGYRVTAYAASARAGVRCLALLFLPVCHAVQAPRLAVPAQPPLSKPFHPQADPTMTLYHTRGLLSSRRRTMTLRKHPNRAWVPWSIPISGRFCHTTPSAAGGFRVQMATQNMLSDPHRARFLDLLAPWYNWRRTAGFGLCCAPVLCQARGEAQRRGPSETPARGWQRTCRASFSGHTVSFPGSGQAAKDNGHRHVPWGGALKNPRIRTLIRNFVIELIIYGLLVVGYFYLVLRLLGEPLRTLFDRNLVLYAVVALALIVAQSVLLEAVTSFLLSRLKLERLE